MVIESLILSIHCLQSVACLILDAGCWMLDVTEATLTGDWRIGLLPWRLKIPFYMPSEFVLPSPSLPFSIPSTRVRRDAARVSLCSSLCCLAAAVVFVCLLFYCSECITNGCRAPGSTHHIIITLYYSKFVITFCITYVSSLAVTHRHEQDFNTYTYTYTHIHIPAFKTTLLLHARKSLYCLLLHFIAKSANPMFASRQFSAITTTMQTVFNHQFVDASSFQPSVHANRDFCTINWCKQRFLYHQYMKAEIFGCREFLTSTFASTSTMHSFSQCIHSREVNSSSPVFRHFSANSSYFFIISV